LKIESAEVRYVTLPFIFPYRTAFTKITATHSVMVRLSSDGVDGWGEATPGDAPLYSPEWAGAAYNTIKDFFLPKLLGEEIDSAADLMNRLAMFKGNPFAKSAVDFAWWALHSKLEGKPLWRVLGGEEPMVPCGAAFGIQDTIDELLSLIQKVVDAKWQRIKLKVCHGWDIEMLAAVRATFPNTVFHVDCNSDYDLTEDIETLRAFDRFHLAMIEQPLAHTDLIEHAELQKQIETPVCLDESIKSPRDFRLALKIGACRVVNVKPGRVGGLHHAIQIHDMAKEAGIKAWVGSMLETNIGTGICVALATLPGFTYPSDIAVGFHKEGITERQVEINESHYAILGETPGTGFEPVPEKLDAVTLRREAFGD